MRNGTISGHSRRVAEYARILGRRAGLSEVDLQNIVFASLLHDIGKIALPDRILERPFFSLPMPDQLEVMKHPVRGQMALMAIEQFKDAAILVRAHHERFDGHGYPDKSSGTSIPVGARIIAIANDFDALQSGMLQSKRFPESEARAWLTEGKGTRYDPELVELFIDKPIERSQATGSGVSLSTSQIRAGMVLASDLISHDGLLLLSKGHALSDSLVAQVRQYEKSEKLALQLDIEKSSIKGTV
jgi:response regulator RpfG family c-di-GMP phosphodiesterase